MKNKSIFSVFVMFFILASFCAAAVTVTPQNPATTDTVTCTYTGSSAPGVFYTFEWYNLNSNTLVYRAAGQGNPGTAFSTLASSYLTAGNNYRCTVVSVGSASFTVQGIPTGPAKYIRITPQNPDRTTTQLTCNLINADAPAVFYTFEWYKNGVYLKRTAGADVAGVPTSTLSTSETAFDRLAEIKCVVPSFASGAVRIQNFDPVFAGTIPTITYPENTNFIVNLSSYFTDGDNDPLTYTYTTTNTDITVTFAGNIATFSNVADRYGFGNVAITATDGYSNPVSSNTFLVNVTAAPIFNQSYTPVLTPFNESKPWFTEILAVNLSPFFYYQGPDPIAFYGTSNHPNVTVIVDPVTGMANVTGSPYWFGNTSVNFTASAGTPQYNRTVTFNATILPVADAPEFINGPIANIDIQEGGYFDGINLFNYFIDHDDLFGGNSMIFGFTRNDTNLNVSINQTTGIVNITGINGAWNGIVDMNFSATGSDDGLVNYTNNFIFNITLIDDNVMLLQNIPNIIFNEDSIYDQLNLTQYFWDEENGTSLGYTFQVSNANIIMGTTGDFMNVSAAGNWSGTATANITATDGNTNVTSNQFTITVNPVNDAPYTNTFPAQIAIAEDAYNDALNMTDYLFDIDDTPLASWYTFNLQNINPANTSVVMTNADKNLVVKITGTYPNINLNITPLANWAGTFEINFTLTDDGIPALSNQNVLLVNVTPSNDAPSLSYTNYTDTPASTPIDITAVSSFTVSETNKTLNVTAVAADSDNEQLWYEWVWDGVIKLGSGILQGVKAVFDLIVLGYRGEASAGNHNLTLRVNDSAGMQIERNWTVTVTNVNHAPDYLGGFTGTIYLNATTYNDTMSAAQYFNETVDGTVGDYSANSVEQGTYSYATNLLSGNLAALVVNLNSTSGALNLSVNSTLNRDAMVELTLTATDPFGATKTSTPLTINITEINVAPYNHTALPTITVKKNKFNDTLSLSNYFADSNSWDPASALTYIVVTNETDVSVSVDSNKRLNITAANNFVGTAMLNITVQDTKGATLFVPGIIINVVEPLALTGVPATVTVNEDNTNNSINLATAVVDPFAPRTYTYDCKITPLATYHTNVPLATGFNSATNICPAGIVTIAPYANWNGNASMNITVSTSEGDVASQLVFIDVPAVDDAPFNNATLGPLTVGSNGLLVNMGDYFVDYDNYPLNFSFTYSDLNITGINPTGVPGQVNITVDYTNLTYYAPVLVNVTEIGGDATYTELIFNVVGNDTIAPSISTINNHTITANSAYVNFTTTEPANYTINWVSGSNSGAASSASYPMGANVQLTSLPPSSLITYTITLCDNSPNKNCYTTAPYTFNTLASNAATVSGYVQDSRNWLYNSMIELTANGITYVTTQTNATGYYSFNLIYGTYNMTVTKNGFSQNLTQVALNPMQTYSMNFTLAQNVGGAVSGTVRSFATGPFNPVAGATVELRDNGVTIQYSVTDINGQYKFNGVPTGTSYTVYIAGASILPNTFSVAGTEVFSKDILMP